MRTIQDILARRPDLNTFLVHLLQGTDASEVKRRLIATLNEGWVRAASTQGPDLAALDRAGGTTEPQHCVSFMETPVEHVIHMLGDIPGHAHPLQPYGVAITRQQGREMGVNPVWYVDTTPGHVSLVDSIGQLIDDAVASEDFKASAMVRLAPFIEPMGPTRSGHRETWWERAWRHVGDFPLPPDHIVFCPEAEMEEVRRSLTRGAAVTTFVDPAWSLEQTISHLAGFAGDHVGTL